MREFKEKDIVECLEYFKDFEQGQKYEVIEFHGILCIKNPDKTIDGKSTYVMVNNKNNIVNSRFKLV